MKRVLSGHALDTVQRVDVLVENDLVARGTTLTGGNGGVRKEELPDTEPSVTVFGPNFFLIGHPVPVPAPKSGTIVKDRKSVV